MMQNYNTEWPSAEALKEHIGDDQLFLTLYKEMYFRHIYASKPVRHYRFSNEKNRRFYFFSFRVAFRSKNDKNLI